MKRRTLTKHNFMLTGVLIATLLWITTPASQRTYLIHGYASSTLYMNSIQKHLKANGIATDNYRYKSIRDDLDTCGRKLFAHVKQNASDTISFVTHSMGGLVVRAMLRYANADSGFPVIWRIVMIAPPNHGAEIADFFSASRFLKTFLGPKVEKMRTDSNSYANGLPFPTRSQVAIIIGARSDSLGYNPFIKGDNDGYLKPDKALLGIEKDVAIVKSEHSFLTQNRHVRNLVLSFLQTGAFVDRP